MALPLLPLLLGGMAVMNLVSAGASIYQTYETTKNSDEVNRYVENYAKGYRDENERYWKQYIARHHLDQREVLYPYRTGYNYNSSDLLASRSAQRNNELARNLSWLQLGKSGGSSAISLYRGLGGN